MKNLILPQAPSKQFSGGAFCFLGMNYRFFERNDIFTPIELIT